MLKRINLNFQQKANALWHVKYRFLKVWAKKNSKSNSNKVVLKTALLRYSR